MSRIGKKPVSVPSNVKVTIGADRTVSVEGPKGTLKMTHRPEVSVAWDDSEKQVVVGIGESDAGNRQIRAYWGTTRSLIENMVKGVTDGYEKKLEIVGVGWTAQVAGQELRMQIGFANAVSVPIPTGVNVTVERQFVTIQGADKQAVGQFAASVRARRKPEPYNGKGIKYVDEVIRRKTGKAFGS